MFGLGKKEKEAKAARLAQEAQEALRAEEAEKLKKVKENVTTHAQGGEKILRALDRIDFESYCVKAGEDDSRISPETMESYREIAGQIKEIIEDAEISDVDTTEIDHDIVEMVALFGTALESGNERTATQILKGIGQGVKFTRCPYVYANEEQRAEKRKKRQKEMNYLLAIARCQDYMDKVKAAVERLKEQLSEQERAKGEAEKRENRLLHENPMLPDMVTKVQMKKMSATPEIINYVNAVNSAMDARNNIRKTELMVAMKEGDLQVVQNSVEKINLMVFGTTELFGNIALDQFQKLYEAFREDIKAIEKENKRLRDLNEAVDITFDTLFQGAIRSEDIARTREYHAERLEEKKREEELQRALEELERIEKEYAGNTEMREESQPEAVIEEE